MNVKIMTKRPAGALLLCLALPLWLGCSNALASEPISNIRAAAEKFALAQIKDEKLSHIEAHAVSLDARLGMAECDQPLEAFSNTNSSSIGRTTVGVRCSGPKPWQLYVPVTISAMAEAVFTVKPLARGENLLLEHLEVKEVALDKLPGSYFSNIEQLNGMALSRSVNSGVILTVNTVKPKLMVERGQEVVILAAGRGIQVRMTGIALKNGASGDLIPIRNVKSGRTIEATVLNSGTVSVNM